MGWMVRASCGCGYSTEPLLAGVGMAGPKPEWVVAMCAACREVTTVPSEGRPLACEDCGSPVSELPEEDALLEEDARFPCPKCGETDLAFQFAGLWD